MLNYLWAAMIAIGIIYAAFTGNLEAITNAALDSAGEGISLCITTAGVMALWMGLMEIAQQAGLVAKLTRGISPVLDFLFPRIPKGHKAREYIATNIIANVLGLGWACTPAGLKAMEELARLEQERGNPEYLDGACLETQGGKRNAGCSGGTVQGRDQNVGNIWQSEGTSVRTDRKTDGKTDRKRSKTRGAGAGGRTASREMCTFLILNISSLQLIPVNMIAYRSQYGSTRPAAIIAPSILATLVSTVAAVVYCKAKDHGNPVSRA